MDGLKIAALYIRVSIDKQEELSPDAQKRLLKEYAEKNGMIVSKEFIFLENGISGKKASTINRVYHYIIPYCNPDHQTG